ncbi:MAG: hypothetical protein EOP19_17145, partial [Hyphomicrobiales bacterium]
PGEVAGIEQAEIVDIGKPREARIDIPAFRMKAGRAHLVPLAPIARDLVLAALKRREDEGDEQALLASRYYNRASLARHSLSHALRRIIPAIKADHAADAKAVASLQAVPPTPHDLRRSTATAMARLGVPPEDRRAVLAHVADDIHGRHYDQYDRLAEKRRALEIWEKHLTTVLDRGEPAETPANVVPMPKRGAGR